MQAHRKSVGTSQFDPQALGQLYETHAPQLLNLCLRYVKNRAEAEDVLHDAFVIIFTHIDTLRDKTKLVHWMTVIVRNLALRHAKAAEERLRLHEAMTEEPADDDSPPPLRAFRQNVCSKRSRHCLAATEKFFVSRCSTDCRTKRSGNCWASLRTVRRRNWHVPNAC